MNTLGIKIWILEEKKLWIIYLDGSGVFIISEIWCFNEVEGLVSYFFLMTLMRDKNTIGYWETF